MTQAGPDMDEVERLVLDPAVKGMICVPMYANPSGVTYANEVVERLARMPTAAEDFRILWDNAYCVHHLYPDRRDRLANLYDACVRAGTPDRPDPVYLDFEDHLCRRRRGRAGGQSPQHRAPGEPDALSDGLLRQGQSAAPRALLPDLAAVERHMEAHARILRPKFELVQQTLSRCAQGVGAWSRPNGGYFVCYRAPRGCARRTVELCAQAGVTLTPAGAAFPAGATGRQRHSHRAHLSAD